MSTPTPEEREFDEALRKAFVVGQADYVLVHSRRQVFAINAITWAERKDYLTTEMCEIDDQETHLIGRPTEAGRAHWGIPSKQKETSCR